MTSEFIKTLWERVSDPATLRVAVVVVVGVLAARLAGQAVAAMVARSSRPNLAPVLQKGVRLVLFTLVGVMALEGLGFDLGVLLGAAGILTVALGFASQTSASNLISGVFMLVEDAFEVGDTIQVGNTVGVLIAVDLLSVKLRTADNRLVRIPNETLIKTELTNLTRYPIRRVDYAVQLPFDVDLSALAAALDRECEAYPLLLEEPPPQLVVTGLTELGLAVKVSAWVATQNLSDGGANLMSALMNALRRCGVNPSLPTRVLRWEGDRPPDSGVV